MDHDLSIEARRRIMRNPLTTNRLLVELSFRHANALAEQFNQANASIALDGFPTARAALTIQASLLSGGLQRDDAIGCYRGIALRGRT